MRIWGLRQHTAHALLFGGCEVAGPDPAAPLCCPHRAGALVWWRWEGVLVAFPIVSYGFTAHQYLFQIYPASQVSQGAAQVHESIACNHLVLTCPLPSWMLCAWPC